MHSDHVGHDSPVMELVMDLAEESISLLGARAMYWPGRQRLVIADLHLGKSHVFLRAGIAIPQGTTQADLQRLSTLIEHTQARELWIVGDILHGPVDDASWKSAWGQWRTQHGSLAVGVLRGNHDRALHTAELGVELLGTQVKDGPFLFRHEPPHEHWIGNVIRGSASYPTRTAGSDGKTENTRNLYVIAGHLHPKVRVAGVPRSWPMFWLQPQMCVLPAFSDFTGGTLARTEAHDRCFACVDGVVVEIPFGKRKQHYAT